jgi:ribosomal protein S1
MTESFAQLFEESLASQRIRPGQILTGRVIDVGPDVVVVSAGLKSEAVIPVQQFKNELAAVKDTEISLISGFPSVQFAHVTSPLSARTTMQWSMSLDAAMRPPSMRLLQLWANCPTFARSNSRAATSR